MAEGPGELRGTIKPDGNHVWNSSRMIQDSTGSLESQIDDWRSTARSIDRSLAIDSQVFSLIISIGQSTS